MLKARKKNRIVRIPEEKADEYKKLGYTLTDEDGNVVYQPEDKDATIFTLKLENSRFKQKIAEYELIMKENASSKAGDAEKQKENEILKAENTDLKEKLEEASAYAEKADKRIEELEKELAERPETEPGPEEGEEPEPGAEDKADGKAKAKGTAAKKK